MNKDVNIALLFDTYGKILSNFQYECLDLYYNQDFSLSEISDNVGKTRQGVYDSIKRAEAILQSAEKKLGFLKKSTELKEKIGNLKKSVHSISFCESLEDVKLKFQKIEELLSKIQI